MAVEARRYSDASKNAFTKTNIWYTKNRLLEMQDPTVLGFKLLFYFDQPDSGLLWGATTDGEAPANTALGFLNSIGDKQRAAYLKKFLYLLHGINNQTPWYFQVLTGLKDAWKQDLSKPLLSGKKLEIECLESIDLRITALMDLYRKACYDWKYRREVIPVNLRQFKMSVYVYEARYIGNPNTIALTQDPPATNLKGEESRSAATMLGELTGPDETINDPNSPIVNTVEGVPMSTTRNLFHFDFCQFDMSEPLHLDGISNMDPQDTKQKFGVMYEDVEEENMYNFWGKDPVTDAFIKQFDDAALDSLPAGTPPSEPAPIDIVQTPNVKGNLIEQGNLKVGERKKGLAGKVGERLGNLKDNVMAKADQALKTFSPGNLYGRLEDQAIAEASNFVGSRLTALGLGNIYGFSPLTLLNTGIGAITSPSAILSAGSSLANNTGSPQVGGLFSDSPSLANTTGTPPQENMGDGSASLSNTDEDGSTAGNIFNP